MFVLGIYDQCAIPPIRRAGLNKAYELVVKEDENTSYQTIGPVSKMMNMIVRFIVDGEGSEAFKMHRIKMRDFMWMGKEGMVCSKGFSYPWKGPKNDFRWPVAQTAANCGISPS